MRLHYRHTTFFFLMLMSSLTYAIETQPLTTQAFSIADGRVSPLTMTEQQKAELFLLEKNAPKSLFPFTSSFTPGTVELHVLPQQESLSAPPFFVIGDDEMSMAWLIQHKDFLENLRAIGMITNVATQARVDAISQQTGWRPLVPVSMEGAESMFHVVHVPFYVSQGVVSQ